MQLSARCYAVTGLAYAPPWSVNAGFVAGDHTTLIVDTGANALAAATIHGYASAARPGNRLMVINTEKHFDHIGGNAWFRERGIDVHGHSGIARTPDEFRAEVAEFNTLIPNAARRAHNEAEVFYHQTSLANPNRPLTAPNSFDLGNCNAEILPTPGHTSTNVSVWVPTDSVLYCGDCLTHLYLPNLDAGTPADWRQWLTSLDRIASLAPKVIVCGHGPVATGDDAGSIMERLRTVLTESIHRGVSPTQ